MSYNNLSENSVRWNLDILYDGPSSEQFIADKNLLLSKVAEISKTVRNSISSMTGMELLSFLKKWEFIEDLSHKISCYSYLLRATALDDKKITAFYQDCCELLYGTSSQMVFIETEMAALSSDYFDQRLLECKELERFNGFFQKIVKRAPYVLSTDKEEIIAVKKISSRESWIRLYDEHLSSLRFLYRGEKKGISELENLLSSRLPDVRDDAFQALSTTLEDNQNIFSFIYNALAYEKLTEDKLRGFKSPISERNLCNDLDDEEVDSLISAVKERYGELSHRYYKIKSEAFGKDALPYRLRDMPYPSEERIYSWEEAKEITLSAYADFSEEFADIANSFFLENRIDAPIASNKMSGAFAHPASPSTRPFVMLNFGGKARDIAIMAHELGHGIHQTLAARNNGALTANASLSLSETASIFGEKLAFMKMIEYEKDPVKIVKMKAGKVEDMLNTVVRQIAFCDFEKRFYEARKKGEVNVNDICDIWISVQKESLGPSIIVDDKCRYIWSRITHFIHVPFYVYAYAFGDCLVNAMYDVYTSGNCNDFRQNYYNLLSSGGSQHHEILLQPFGLSIKNGLVWKKGLNSISALLDEVEINKGFLSTMS